MKYADVDADATRPAVKMHATFPSGAPIPESRSRLSRVPDRHVPHGRALRAKKCRCPCARSSLARRWPAVPGTSTACAFLRLRFDKLPTGKASRFFVAGQQQNYRTLRTSDQSTQARMTSRARAQFAFISKTPGPYARFPSTRQGRLPQRTARVNCIRVPQDHNRF